MTSLTFPPDPPLGRTVGRERRDNLPVLYATGYAASFSASEADADVLAKPYRDIELMAKLRTLMAPRPQRSRRPAS